MNEFLPLFLLLCLGVGGLRRVPVYDAFVEGAKEGLKTAGQVLPALLAMLCAIRAFSASGLLPASQASSAQGMVWRDFFIPAAARYSPQV